MKKEQSKAAKKTIGRPCAICTHEKVKEINSLILKPTSFRGISLKYGMSDMSVNRHAQNCLNLEIASLIKEQKIERAIDVYEEFRQQLEFAKKTRAAAERWLTDPVDENLFTVDPRADEIEVIYFDSTQPDANGNPTRCKAPLQELLARVGGKDFIVVNHFIKTVDLRDHALKVLDRCDTAIDKFAKLGGLYTKERENPDSLSPLAAGLNEWLNECRRLNKEFGVPMPTVEEITAEVSRAAVANSVDPQKLQDRIQIVDSIN